jgi:hypothetical protein
MLKLLVAIDRSLEASIALRMACFFGLQIHIQPIFVSDPPGRNMSFGAGWAWKSWERETSQQAEETIEDLVITERNQCPNIEDPVVLIGEPFQKIAHHYFTENDYDLLVTGAPFRGMEPKAMCNRYGTYARKTDKELPLLMVRHLKNINRIIALTDGGVSAEKALGVLIRLAPLLSADIVLVALAQSRNPSPNAEALNLERGLAIFKEKGIEVSGHTRSSLDARALKRDLHAADLVVAPYPADDTRSQWEDLLMVDDIKAALFCIGKE